MRNADASTIAAMKTNNVILYVLALACAFFGFDMRWGYTATTPWWTHLTFHFAHGNIFHLAANMLVAFLLLLNRKDRWWLWPLCYAVAVACSFCVGTDKPTVGLSGTLLAYYGVICFKDGARWRSMLYTLVYMAVSFLFAARLAIGLHLACLAVGSAIGGAMLWKKNIERKTTIYD